MDLSKWIFEEYSKLNLNNVMSELNKHEIDFCKKSDSFGIVLKTSGGVKLNFTKDFEELLSDNNQLHITAFSLISSS